MAFVTNPKYRGRVRTTRRIVSEPNRLGHRTLLAREGETMSIREAFRRGIPEDALEPVGPAGEAAFAVLRERDDGAPASSELIAKAEAAGDDADRPELSSDADRTRGLLRPAGDDVEYPRRKGGPYWELSDGSTFRGSADEAAAAEVALAADGDQDGDGSGVDADGDQDGDGSGVDADGDQDGDGSDVVADGDQDGDGDA